MITNPDISEKRLHSLIMAINSNKTRPLKHIIVLMSVFISCILVYMMYINTGKLSIKSLVICSICFSVFLLALLYIAKKSSLAGGLVNVSSRIQDILNDDWSYPFYNITNIDSFIIKHPVYRSIIGLYLCKYGKETEGLDLIQKAKMKLPSINDAIDGTIVKDRKEFANLQTHIFNDLNPNKYIKIFDFISIIAMLVSLLLTINFLSKHLWRIFANL